MFAGLILYEVLFKVVDDKATLFVSLENDKIFATIITVIIGYITKNLFATIIVRMVSLILIC